MGDVRAYGFALAPAVVVLAVAPALALLPDPISPSLGPVRYLGLLGLGGGLGLVGWTLRAFAAAGEPPSPADPPRQLVTRGPLAYSRNPLYLGTVIAALGEALLLESVVVAGYGLLLWLVYHLLTVYREEPELRAQFGEDFDDYCERVPRWF